jgi:hypothetical protein
MYYQNVEKFRRIVSKSIYNSKTLWHLLRFHSVLHYYVNDFSPKFFFLLPVLVVNTYCFVCTIKAANYYKIVIFLHSEIATS